MNTVMLEQHADRIKKFWPDTSAYARAYFPKFCAQYGKIKQFNCPNYLGARIPLESDLNIEQWRLQLKNFHDKELCEFLLYGWPLGYHADLPPESAQDNHPLAKQFGQHVEKFIRTEKGFNVILGPFKE